MNFVMCQRVFKIMLSLLILGLFTLPAFALMVDDFSEGSDSLTVTSPDTSDSFTIGGLSSVPGGDRVISIALTDRGQSDAVNVEVTGSGVLMINATGLPDSMVTVQYGLNVPMGLNLSAANQLLFTFATGPTADMDLFVELKDGLGQTLSPSGYLNVASGTTSYTLDPMLFTGGSVIWSGFDTTNLASLRVTFRSKNYQTVGYEPLAEFGLDSLQFVSVPEPGTYLLLLTGLGVLIAVRYRKIV
jgi:hypothetical protein